MYTLRVALLSVLLFTVIWAVSLTMGGPAAASPATAGTVAPLAAQATVGAQPAKAAPGHAEADAPKRSPQHATAESDAEESSGLTEWFNEVAPLLILLVLVSLVMWRLPKLDLGHSKAFMRRRVMNWLPLGLTYAFLYMGRYNLTVAKESFGDLMPVEDFSIIFAAGTITYGFSFIINGPLTDRLGGKRAILIGAGGAALANAVMGLMTYLQLRTHMTLWFAVIYAMNMYFQSFGAVAIVKVNAPWFHVRERGVFGAIFGILISLGIYFAFDWSGMVVRHLPTFWVFLVPAGILVLFWVIVFLQVQDSPGKAGFEDFNTGDATAGDEGPALPPAKVFKMMLTNPIILTIAAIEFCSGFLRQSIMHYYHIFAASIGQHTWVLEHWGLLLAAAGITGGVVAGVISDHVFESRRGPVATLLYGVMLLVTPVMAILLGNPVLGWLSILMSMAVIGVHGMMSGTASMDFGGSKNADIAVGIIDGFVYLGTAVMAGTYAVILPTGEAAKDVSNWHIWPLSMLPVAAIGLFLASRLWNAKPQPKGAGGH